MTSFTLQDSLLGQVSNPQSPLFCELLAKGSVDVRFSM